MLGRFFQLKAIGSEKVQMLLQLKLAELMPSNYDSFQVTIPLSSRGKITKVESAPAVGTVFVDKGNLVWRIGQKWKSPEVSMPATVHFSDEPIDTTAPGYDAFLCGLNCYAQVSFKATEFSIAGTTIDPSSVTSSASAKVKPQVVREFSSAEYMIWNSLGDSRRIEGRGKQLTIREV